LIAISCDFIIGEFDFIFILGLGISLFSLSFFWTLFFELFFITSFNELFDLEILLEFLPLTKFLILDTFQKQFLFFKQLGFSFISSILCELPTPNEHISGSV
jgi:hypothetical protein